MQQRNVYAAPRIGPLASAGAMPSIRAPDTPVINRVPRWNVM
jgi:hypothetical protein